MYMIEMPANKEIVCLKIYFLRIFRRFCALANDGDTCKGEDYGSNEGFNT